LSNGAIYIVDIDPLEGAVEISCTGLAPKFLAPLSHAWSIYSYDIVTKDAWSIGHI